MRPRRSLAPDRCCRAGNRGATVGTGRVRDRPGAGTRERGPGNRVAINRRHGAPFPARRSRARCGSARVTVLAARPARRVRRPASGSGVPAASPRDPCAQPCRDAPRVNACQAPTLPASTRRGEAPRGSGSGDLAACRRGTLAPSAAGAAPGDAATSSGGFGGTVRGGGLDRPRPRPPRDQAGVVAVSPGPGHGPHRGPSLTRREAQDCTPAPDGQATAPATAAPPRGRAGQISLPPPDARRHAHPRPRQAWPPEPSGRARGNDRCRSVRAGPTRHKAQPSSIRPAVLRVTTTTTGKNRTQRPDRAR